MKSLPLHNAVLNMKWDVYHSSCSLIFPFFMLQKYFLFQRDLPVIDLMYKNVDVVDVTMCVTVLQRTA